MSGQFRHVTVDIRRLPHAPAELPGYQTPGAAGMDLCLAGDDAAIMPGQCLSIPTGFSVAISTGYEGQVRLRSGFAMRSGLIIPNAPGTIDSDYRGEIKILVLNTTGTTVRVARGERIAQLIIAPVAHCNWSEVSELPGSNRGANGFGSTGNR